MQDLLERLLEIGGKVEIIKYGNPIRYDVTVWLCHSLSYVERDANTLEEALDAALEALQDKINEVT